MLTLTCGETATCALGSMRVVGGLYPLGYLLFFLCQIKVEMGLRGGA